MRANRAAVHRFYDARRRDCAAARPGPAHAALARLQARHAGTALITQNVDGLLEAAGCRDVLHVHGRVEEMACAACGLRWTVGPDVDGAALRCPRERCRSLKAVRPGIVFFGDPAPGYGPMSAAFDGLREGDVLLVWGTSCAVVDAASVAARSPATTVLSNLASAEPPEAPYGRWADDRKFDHVLHGPADDVAGEVEALVGRLLDG